MRSPLFSWSHVIYLRLWRITSEVHLYFLQILCIDSLSVPFWSFIFELVWLPAMKCVCVWVCVCSCSCVCVYVLALSSTYFKADACERWERWAGAVHSLNLSLFQCTHSLLILFFFPLLWKHVLLSFCNQWSWQQCQTHSCLKDCVMCLFDFKIDFKVDF